MWWADKWRWTPEQVDSINAERAERMRFAAAAMDEGRANAAKRSG